MGTMGRVLKESLDRLFISLLRIFDKAERFEVQLVIFIFRVI
jgi:hypothetical protein